MAGYLDILRASLYSRASSDSDMRATPDCLPISSSGYNGAYLEVDLSKNIIEVPVYCGRSIINTICEDTKLGTKERSYNSIQIPLYFMPGGVYDRAYKGAAPILRQFSGLRSCDHFKQGKINSDVYYGNRGTILDDQHKLLMYSVSEFQKGLEDGQATLTLNKNIIYLDTSIYTSQKLLEKHLRGLMLTKFYECLIEEGEYLQRIRSYNPNRMRDFLRDTSNCSLEVRVTSLKDRIKHAQFPKGDISDTILNQILRAEPKVDPITQTNI